MMVVYTVVVLVHTFAKLRQPARGDTPALDFDVYEDPEVGVVFTTDFNQFVGVTFTVNRAVIDGLEFAVQKGDGLLPVDLLVQTGHQQVHEMGEVLLQGVFPRAVVVRLGLSHVPGFLSVKWSYSL